ncbi:MAG TPA: biopolymer transporter ExbD [Pirellulaceae bacterium]|nr:biopolymer transporter ExbD [Pirellulaceae bacterium]
MPLKTHQDDMPAINLTPMIDIVFNLIIFFMVGARFTELERKVDLTVPQVADIKALTPTPDKRNINVYRDGRIELDSQSVSLEQLTAALASAHQEYSDLGVVVRGDQQTPFQNVASVLTACRQAGITEMGISVRLGTKER